MKKLNITVYAISKNESKFVDRWYESMKEADNIVVLDTGSIDDTVQKLKNHNIIVETKEINPWRFDVARNESLKLIPTNTDICVCTDLDEVFEKGWREKLEKTWKANTKQLRYKYVWNVLENNADGITFLYEKIHSFGDFIWANPVHEILKPVNRISSENIVTNNEIVLRHFPDPTKSRKQYLSLLELSILEDPLNDRNTHYLAREYMFNSMYNKAIKTFKKHLKLKSSTWNEERSASLRYIGNCYSFLNKKHIAEKYYKKSIIECPTTREPYYELAKHYYINNDYLLCLFTLNQMLSITKKTLSYITSPECWNEVPYDMLSFCYYKTNQITKALNYSIKALEIKPNDNRIINNIAYYKSIINKI